MFKPEKFELKIHGLLKSDQGKYTCQVSNTEGSIEHTYQVEVMDYIRDIPILVEQSRNLTLLTGMTARFYCKFEADMAMLIHWLRPEESLRNSENETELDGSNPEHFETILDANGNSYMGENFTIENVQAEDAGLYFCVGQTNAGMTPGKNDNQSYQLMFRVKISKISVLIISQKFRQINVHIQSKK